MSLIYEEVDPVYAKKCSNITLCSNTAGFFKDLSEEVVSLAEEDDWIESFEKVEDARKVTAVMENKTVLYFCEIKEQMVSLMMWVERLSSPHLTFNIIPAYPYGGNVKV